MAWKLVPAWKPATSEERWVAEERAEGTEDLPVLVHFVVEKSFQRVVHTIVSGTYTKIKNNQNTIVLYLRGFCSPLKDDSGHWVRCTSVCISSSDSDSSLTKWWKTDGWPSMLFCKKMHVLTVWNLFQDFYTESFKFHSLAVRLKQKLQKTDIEN